MLALYIILGIILFFVVVFSIPVGIIIDYAEQTVIKIKYLFVNITVVDTSKPKKEKKKKDKKPDKKKKSEKKSENTDENKDDSTGEKTEEIEGKNTDKNKGKDKKPKQKGESLLNQIYKDHGYDGIKKMLSSVGNALNGFFGKLVKTFVFDEMYIEMITAGSDAADTAIKHGKLCAMAYPVLGKLVSTGKVKKYDFNFSPDFLAAKNRASAYVRLHFTVIHITNAVVVLAFKLLFGVLIKLFFSKTKVDKINKKLGLNSDAQAESAGEDSQNTSDTQPATDENTNN